MKERSIFWPLVMIATGVLWLLIGMDIIPRANLWALLHIFPYLLIALGLGLILRAYWRFAGMLVSLLVVAGAVTAVYYAPRFGWNSAPGWSWVVDWVDFDSDLGGAIAGSGVVKSESHQVSDFDSIAVDFPAEITVRQGDSESAVIEAEDNLLPQLALEVRDGTLHFENTEHQWSERVNPTKPVLMTITVVDLKQVRFATAGKMLIDSLKTDSLTIAVSGAGDLTLKELDVNTLDFRLSGAGNIYADGKADNLQVSISGLGNFNGGELQSQAAEVNISGAGSATAWVEQDLQARISGAGSISYYGDPHVNKSISGAGSINEAGRK